MSEKQKGRALKCRDQKWRREWIARFIEKHHAAKRWISFGDLVEWCAQPTPGASFNDASKARDAYRSLTNSVRKGEFERDNRSKILYLDPLAGDGVYPHCRLTRHQFEIIFEGAAPSLPLEVLNCCWLRRELALHWLEAHGYRWSPRFQPAPEMHTSCKIEDSDLQLGWIPITAALEIVEAVAGDLACEQLMQAIRSKSLPARCLADGVTCEVEPIWLDFLAIGDADDDLLLFDRQGAWHAKVSVPHQAEDVTVELARCAELWPDCGWRKPLYARSATDAARADREFQSLDWSLGNVLSWISFRDPALICQFEDRTNVFFFKLYKYPRSQDPRRPMLVASPDRALLEALQKGLLVAIRNGVEIPSSYWFGKYTQSLSHSLRFRHAEVITCRPTESAEGSRTAPMLQQRHPNPGEERPVHRPPSREKPFWPEGREKAREWLTENGCPAPNDGNQATLERHVAERLEYQGREASESAIRRHVGRWIEEYRQKLSA